jgi:hypothetical protein
MVTFQQAYEAVIANAKNHDTEMAIGTTVEDLIADTERQSRVGNAADQWGLNNEELSRWVEEAPEDPPRIQDEILSKAAFISGTSPEEWAAICEMTPKFALYVEQCVIIGLKFGVLVGAAYTRLNAAAMDDIVQDRPRDPDDK